MSTVQIDDDARRLMSPEELEALGEDYDPEADNEAALDGAQRSDAEAAEAGAAAAATPATEAPAAAAAAAAAEAQAAAAAEASATDAQADYSHAPYVVELPADHADKVQANKQARKELLTKYNNGDLDQAEYEAAQERLDDERLELASQKQRADIAAEMSQQAANNAWVSTINTFVAEVAKTDKVDYLNDADKQADLDNFVKALGAKEANKPMRWYLEEAHKRVMALHGLTAAAPAKKAETKRAPDLESITQNLAHVAGAGGTDPLEDEFAALDKLEGLDAERALAGLSAEKQRLYLQRA